MTRRADDTLEGFCVEGGRIANAGPVTFFMVPAIGAAGLQARHDLVPLSVMIEKVVSLGLVGAG